MLKKNEFDCALKETELLDCANQKITDEILQKIQFVSSYEVDLLRKKSKQR